MIFIPVAIVILILLVIYARPETRGCRWRADRGRDTEGRHFFHCVACGATALQAEDRPPGECLAPRG